MLEKEVFEEAKHRLEDVKAKYVDVYNPYDIPKDTSKGLKYDNDKLRYDLYPIPAYEGCTKVLTFGASKYAPNNWRKVDDPINRYYAALIRHINDQMKHYRAGKKGLALDDETGLPHLDHAQCCLIFMRELA